MDRLGGRRGARDGGCLHRGRRARRGRLVFGAAWWGGSDPSGRHGELPDHGRWPARQQRLGDRDRTGRHSLARHVRRPRGMAGRGGVRVHGGGRAGQSGRVAHRGRTGAGGVGDHRGARHPESRRTVPAGAPRVPRRSGGAEWHRDCPLAAGQLVGCRPGRGDRHTLPRGRGPLGSLESRPRTPLAGPGRRRAHARGAGQGALWAGCVRVSRSRWPFCSRHSSRWRARPGGVGVTTTRRYGPARAGCARSSNMRRKPW